MRFRPFSKDRDAEHVERIWRECGWFENDDGPKGLAIFLDACTTWLFDLHGEAECSVSTLPGSMRYLDQTVDIDLVAAVTTSRVARKQGVASRLTAHAIADSAQRGAAVSVLGMFEQGFYNRLGYGTGSYVHVFDLDPAMLRIPGSGRAGAPRRLGRDDFEAIHANRVQRCVGHGGVVFPDPRVTEMEAIWSVNGSGLGYYDHADGTMSHHLWMSCRELESGPYRIAWLAYENQSQLLELFGLVRNLGDQLKLVTIAEPTAYPIMLQDLIGTPFRHAAISRRGGFEQRSRAVAWWQARICDLPRCVAHCPRPGHDLRFNLELADPIASLLPDDAPWRGVGGSYVVTLGATSGAESGSASELPTLRASVGAFTRYWMGSARARGLAITDDFKGDPALIDALDRVMADVPCPHPDWDF